MPLSRNYTIKKLFDEARRAAGVSINSVAYCDRVNMVNSAVSSIFNQFHAFMSNSYMTSIPMRKLTAGKYSSSGTGSFTASTNRLTFQGMNNGFAAGDEEKQVMFRVGSAVYAAVINSVASAIGVELRGDGLPTTDQTVDGVMVASTVQSGSEILLSLLRIDRMGGQSKMRLDSSITTSVFPVSLDEYRTFNASAIGNKKKLVWVLEGDKLLVKGGGGLSSWGTLTLNYPRTPDFGSNDAAMVDLPDGLPIQIALIVLQSRIVRMEYGQDVSANDLPKISGLIEMLYRSFGLEVNLQNVKDAIKALV